MLKKLLLKRAQEILEKKKKRIVGELKKADGGKVRGKQKAQPTPRKPKSPKDQTKRRMGDRSKRPPIKIKKGKQDGIKLYSTEKKDGGKVRGQKSSTSSKRLKETSN